MIDIHCHILHGVDDGAKDLNESVAMARIAYEDGVRHIYATPHFNASYFNHKDIVKPKVKELQEALDQLNIDVTIHIGNEVCLHDANFVYEHAKQGNFCYLGESANFILLEQPWKGFSPDSVEIVRWFRRRGTTPIVPHPERHTFFRGDPGLLDSLIEEGAWTQVSVDSLLGNNSEQSQSFAYGLMKRNLIHTLATDAHNLHRKPNLSEGYRIVREEMGEKRANEIQERMRQICDSTST